ncbi:hypothetical protein D3C86_1523730 [compost metagenome]
MRSLKLPLNVEEAREKIVATITGLSLHDAEWALDAAMAALHQQQDVAMQRAVFDAATAKSTALPETDV